MTRDAYLDPIYNLKAVSERTGVTADALRAWERRYGLPLPSRTPAGHRIYAQRDIDVINWLVARQEEGLRIGRAVKLWQSLESEGQDPLRTMPVPSAPPLPKRPVGETIEQLRDEWVSHCLAFNEQKAGEVLTQALAMYPPEIVFSGIIGAGIAEIGHSWFVGDVTVQQEHFASELAMRRLKGMIEAAPAPTRRGRILTACPAGEEHTLGMSAFTLLLRRAGWDVVYLGANVPVETMAATIERIQPDLICLAAQRLATASSLLDVVGAVEDLDVPIAYGGRIFNEEPGIRLHFPAHFLGGTLDQAVGAAERLLTTARPTLAGEAPSEETEALHAHFLEHLPAIRTDVYASLGHARVSRSALEALTGSLTGATAAALRFDDLDLLAREIDWYRAYDEQSEPSARMLDAFLPAYKEAVAAHLDQRGEPLVAWLNDRVAQGQEENGSQA